MIALPQALKSLNGENLQDDYYTDDQINYYLETFNNMHDRLRSPAGNTLYDYILKGVKAYEEADNPGAVQVGLDKRELEEQQQKYIYFNNPVVEKMAKMLENDPKGRAALFDGDVKLENLNPEKLKEAYDKAAIELAKEDLKKQQAPVLA